MDNFTNFDRKREFCQRYTSPQNYTELDVRQDRFEKAMERLYSHRQKLAEKLANNAITDNYQEFEGLKKELSSKIKDAKKIVQNDKDEYEKIVGKIGDLIVPLTNSEQLLNVFKLLRETLESKKSLQSMYQSVKQEYKKMALPNLQSHLSIIRQYFRQLVISLHGLLSAKIDKDARIYTFIYELVKEWHSKLLELCQQIFVWSFDLVKWPIITLEDSYSLANSEHSDIKISLFQDLFRFLLELETGLVDNSLSLKCFEEIDIFIQPGEATFFLPLKLMADPLTNRFDFLFMSKGSNLNNFENPEWALCQTEQWIGKNAPFLFKNTDSILNEYFGESGRSSKYQLTCCLLECVKRKLTRDLPHLSDSRLYSLTIDEVIIFNKQVIAHVPGIFELEPELNPIQVFFPNVHQFERFSRLLLDRLNEFVEGIFESDLSWNVLDSSDSSQNSSFIVCEAADKFSLLLQSLIEKSHFIPDMKFKLRIVNLILKVIDDFRLRLTQLIHNYSGWPFNQKFYSILNAFEFFVAQITEWQHSSYFMDICFSNDRDMKQFEDLKLSYEHMIDEIVNRIQSVIMSHVSNDLLRYKRMNWHSYSIDTDCLEVSSAGANLIYNLSSKCAIVKSKISASLYEKFISDIASNVEELLFQRLILEHKFNRDGAKQLQFDVEYGFMSFFSMNSSNCFFNKLSESLIILTCSPKTCHTLEEDYNLKGGHEIRQSLKKIGVYSLHSETVIQVIQHRIGFS